MAKTVPNWAVITSENGWTSNDIAVKWLEDVFVPQMDQIRKEDQGKAVLLILDAHKSRASVSLFVPIIFGVAGRGTNASHPSAGVYDRLLHEQRLLVLSPSTHLSRASTLGQRSFCPS